jgi:hypothetical protein
LSQINGGDQSIIDWMIEIQSESFWLPYMWQLKKKFNHHTIGDEMLFVTIRYGGVLVIK